MALLRKPRFIPLSATATLAAVIAAQPASSLETSVEIGTAAEHHSNALRTNDDEQSDTLYALIGRFGLEHAGQSLDALLGYDIENQRYADDSFGNENITNGNANIDWRIVQDTVSLLVDHTIADTIADSVLPDTPDNRTRRSVLAAGPRFTARLSGVDNIELTARKVYVDVDEVELESETPESPVLEDPNDSERDEVTLQWNRRLPQSRTFYTGVSHADVTFDNAPSQDYRYSAAFIGLGLTSRLATLTTEIGANKAARKEGNVDDSDGHTINVVLRTIDASSPLQGSLYYIKAITDSSIGFVGESSLPPTTSDDDNESLGIVDIVERERGGIDSTFALGDRNTQLTLMATIEKQDFEEQPRDDEIRSIGVGIARQSTEKLNSRLYTDLTKQEYLDLDQDRDERRIGVEASYAVTDAFDIRVDAYRLKSEHSTDTLSYSDTVVRLEFSYRLQGTAPTSTPR